MKQKFSDVFTTIVDILTAIIIILSFAIIIIHSFLSFVGYDVQSEPNATWSESAEFSQMGELENSDGTPMLVAEAG